MDTREELERIASIEIFATGYKTQRWWVIAYDDDAKVVGKCARFPTTDVAIAFAKGVRLEVKTVRGIVTPIIHPFTIDISGPNTGT